MEMGVMDENGYEGYWSCMHGSMHASRRGIGKGVYQGMYGNLSKGGMLRENGFEGKVNGMDIGNMTREWV